MNRSILFGFLFSVLALSAPAQESAPDKPKEGFVRIINACTVELKEPWRAGVDLTFKDQVLARDMRGGEGAAYKPITFVGKDAVDVMPTGQKTKVSSVPASFEKGGFYSILLTGMINEDGFKVAPLVVPDFPVPEAKIRQGFGRVKVLNAVTTFPVSLKLDDGTATRLEPLALTELFLTPGSHPYGLTFAYKGQPREMQGFLTVTAGSQSTAVIFASPEKPDRPVLRLWDDSAQMRAALEAAEAAKKPGADAAAETPGG